MIAVGSYVITESDWTTLLNIVVHKLKKRFFLEIDELYSAAAMGIVLAHRKFDPDRSNNIKAYLVSKGCLMAHDILRNEWRMRSVNGPLHDVLTTYFEETPYKRISSYEQESTFEETMEDFSEQLSVVEKQILRERFLFGEMLNVIGQRRGIGKTAVSLRITRIINKIRIQLLEKDNITKQQRKQLESLLHGSRSRNQLATTC